MVFQLLNILYHCWIVIVESATVISIWGTITYLPIWVPNTFSTPTITVDACTNIWSPHSLHEKEPQVRTLTVSTLHAYAVVHNLHPHDITIWILGNRPLELSTSGPHMADAIWKTEGWNEGSPLSQSLSDGGPFRRLFNMSLAFSVKRSRRPVGKGLDEMTGASNLLGHDIRDGILGPSTCCQDGHTTQEVRARSLGCRQQLIHTKINR